MGGERALCRVAKRRRALDGCHPTLQEFGAHVITCLLHLGRYHIVYQNFLNFYQLQFGIPAYLQKKV